MENVDMLVGAKEVELLAWRAHPYIKDRAVIKHVGEIKNYDAVVYDKDEKCIMFLRAEKEGKMEIVDRLQCERVVNIRKSSLGGAIVIVD